MSFTLKHANLDSDGIEGCITITVPEVLIVNVVMEGTQFTTFYFYTKRIEHILKAVRGKLTENLMVVMWDKYLENEHTWRTNNEK